MNGFRLKPKRGHVTMAVALIGAAVTLGFAIWQSQKGKHQFQQLSIINTSCEDRDNPDPELIRPQQKRD
jgi:hypothetical protein